MTQPSYGRHTIFAEYTWDCTPKKNQAKQTTSITQWRFNNSSCGDQLRLTKAKGIPQIQVGELITEWVYLSRGYPQSLLNMAQTWQQSIKANATLYTLLLEHQGMKRLPRKTRFKNLIGLIHALKRIPKSKIKSTPLLSAQQVQSTSTSLKERVTFSR